MCDSLNDFCVITPALNFIKLIKSKQLNDKGAIFWQKLKPFTVAQNAVLASRNGKGNARVVWLGIRWLKV
jgi:hypothetical protein